MTTDDAGANFRTVWVSVSFYSTHQFVLWNDWIRSSRYDGANRYRNKNLSQLVDYGTDVNIPGMCSSF